MKKTRICRLSVANLILRILAVVSVPFWMPTPIQATEIFKRGLTVIPLRLEPGVATGFGDKLAGALEKAGGRPGANIIAFGEEATGECDYDRCSERIGHMTRTSHLLRGTIRFTNLGGRVDLILETRNGGSGKSERIVDGYLTLTQNMDLDRAASALAEGLLLCVDNPLCPISNTAVWGKGIPPMTKVTVAPNPPVKKVTENASATALDNSNLSDDCDREGCLVTPAEASQNIVEKAENDAPPPPPPDPGCGDDRAGCRSASATREVREASPEVQMTSDGPAAVSSGTSSDSSSSGNSLSSTTATTINVISGPDGLVPVNPPTRIYFNQYNKVVGAPRG